MQTFLPYPSFSESAACLDYRRLGKQRLEAKQILLALENPSYGWQNHPAVNMWRGYAPALAAYGQAICEEWIYGRGYKDTLRPFFAQRVKPNAPMPPWFGNKQFHRSHQSNLVRKLPDHYRRFFNRVPADLPYVWPVV